MKRALLAALGFLLAAGAHAQTYPNRNIRVLEPLAAGSSVDVITRIVTDKMGQILQGSFYVDNQPAGLSAGDVLAQHSVWYQGGHRVGAMAVDSLVTLRTSDQTGEVMFTAVARLPQGRLVMTGSFFIVPQNQTFEAAVTGGTGAFEKARGHAVFEQTSGTTTKVTLNLS